MHRAQVPFHALLQLAGRWLGRGKLSILVYHQVLPCPDPMRPSEPTAATFEWHMELIARYFNPLPLSEAVQGLRRGGLPRNAICVTFDDGYRNVLEVAQPIMQRHGVPATLYVATAFLDRGNMWNDRIIDLCGNPALAALATNEGVLPLEGNQQRREAATGIIRALKYLPVSERSARVDEIYRLNNASEHPARMLTTEELRRLHGLGVEIGAHTHRHPILRCLPAAEQAAEIETSRTILQQVLDSDVTHFAYPNGKEGTDFDETTAALVERIGFTSAVVTDAGYCTAATSPYRLRRFTPWDRHPLAFHLRLIRNYQS